MSANLDFVSFFKVKSNARFRVITDAITVNKGITKKGGFTNQSEGLFVFGEGTEGVPYYFALQSPENLLSAPANTFDFMQAFVRGDSSIVANLDVPAANRNFAGSAGGDSTVTGLLVSGSIVYVWEFWDGSVYTTRLPYFDKILTRGGSLPWKVTAVNERGQTQVLNSFINVNDPPIIDSLTTSVNEQVVPYTTTVTVMAHEVDGEKLQYKWYVDGQVVVGADSTIVIPVTNVGDTVVTVELSDGVGGVTTDSVTQVGIINLPPEVTPISQSPSRIMLGSNLTATFTAFARDPDGNNATLFRTWTITPQQGTVTIQSDNSVVSGDYVKYYIVCSFSAETVVGVSLRVQDALGGTTSVSYNTQTYANHPPVIDSVTATPSSIEAGGAVSYVVKAHDADHQALTYTWNFAPVAPFTPITSSQTLLQIGTGPKTLTVDRNLNFVIGQQTLIIADGTAHQMQGIVTAYNPATGVLVVNVSFVVGAGNSFSAWTVSLAKTAFGASTLYQTTIDMNGTLNGTISVDDLEGGLITIPTPPVTILAYSRPEQLPIITSVTQVGQALVVAWNYPTTDISLSSFEVWRSADGTNFSKVTRGNANPMPLGASVRTYSDLSVGIGLGYYYQVRVNRTGGQLVSQKSNVVVTSAPTAITTASGSFNDAPGYNGSVRDIAVVAAWGAGVPLPATWYLRRFRVNCGIGAGPVGRTYAEFHVDETGNIHTTTSALTPFNTGYIGSVITDVLAHRDGGVIAGSLANFNINPTGTAASTDPNGQYGDWYIRFAGGSWLNPTY